MRGTASRHILECFNHIGIPTPANTTTGVSTAGVNASTGESTGVKDHIRSNFPQGLVVGGAARVEAL